jgi:predicted transcriptional regulator
MAFCPNLSDPQVKEEFDALVKKYGEASAYDIWDSIQRANNAGKIRATINQTAAKAWLAERFPGMSLEFYDTAKQVGDGFVHGYVHNAGMHLWTAAESGTEYHEAYHMTFRTMLSEEQRQGLYEEARKQFGEPTADEVSNILAQFPEISNEEASNLALEEKMAEEFREYVLTEEESGKGLLGKIAKWFKNLFNWIKAMVSDNLSLKQTYSLIQSNNMGKSLAGRNVFRNPQKFQGHDVAYMHRTEYTEQDFTEIKDTLYTIFMDTKNAAGSKFDVSNAMGVEGNKGSIAEGILTRLYKKQDGSSVDIPTAVELFAGEEEARQKRTPESINAFKALLAKSGSAPALGDNKILRNMAADVYRTWNTTLNPVTGNVEKYGWRDILVERLQDNGLKVTGKDVTEYELQKDSLPTDEQEALDQELEEIDGVVEKIYGKSELGTSPAKRLTGKVKELLSTIKSSMPDANGDVKVNKFGVNTYLDKETVYRELLEVFTGKQSFSDMVTALENAAVYKPNIMNPVLEFVKGLDAPQKAMLYNAFSLATTEFVLMKSKSEPNNKLRVEIFNPNRKGKAEKLVDSWRNAVIATEDPNSRGLYKAQQLEEKEGEEPTLTYAKIDSRINEVVEAFKALEKIMPARPLGAIPMEPGVTHPLVKGLGDLMWSMGLNVGDNMNIQDTYDNIHKIVSNGFYVSDASGSRKVEGQMAAKTLQNKLYALMNGIASFKPANGSLVGSMTPVANTNFIINKKAVALEIAEFFAPVLSIAGESHVSANGAQIYATNTQSHMQEIVNDLKTNRDEFIKRYMQDPFIGAYGNPEFQSILFRAFQNEDFFREFRLEDLDAIKESDRFDDAITYGDMSKIDSYVVRINAFVNAGRSDTTKIFASVQADRDKMTANNVPRLSKLSAKMQYASRAELIKAQIVQDFLRMAEARRIVLSKDTSLFVDGYHNDPKTGVTIDENGNFLGRAFDPKFFQFTALDENGKQIVTDEVLTKTNQSVLEKNTLSTVIDRYVKGKLSKEEKAAVDIRLNAMVAKLDTYMKNQAAKLKQILSEKLPNDETHLDRIDNISLPSLKVDDILEGFVFEETLMRNELVKLYRGSRAYSKNLVDFYKRMGHLTSPGSKYALKSDNVGSVDWMPGEAYGMMDTFNEITLADLKLNATPEQIERANKAADNMRDSLVASGVPLAQAVSISNAYRAGKFDSTDAQAFISLEMHRGLMQGEGKWFKEDEMAYKNYKQTGEFVYVKGFVPKGYKAGDAVPVYPTKTYFEKLQLVGSSITPISEKNSYSVLLKSYTKDFPKLEDLRQRMESEGVYAGMDPVHVVNFVSGKKLAKRNVHTVIGKPGEFATTVINVNQSRGLRKPQTIPEMKDNPIVTLNRQIKKNMMANVKGDTKYIYNAGIEGKEVQLDGSQMQDLYHAAIEEKLARDMQDVMQELKISDLQEALGTKDPKIINDAKLDVLKNIRDIIYKQILDGDLHSNYYRALDIELEADGSPRFKVPLDLPIYNKKFESIIMSVMSNRVFKQSVKGYEAVQVAQIGGHETNDELKFYEIVPSNGKQRLAHAEIMIREDLARQFGIKPGQALDEVPEELRRLIGYRIPNQDKASTVILKIKAFLPESYAKSVVVPGQLVKLMGSDFDVDKLFLMFPEVEQDRESKYGIKKVIPDYQRIATTPGMITDRKAVSDKQLNNIILDTMEAVMSNPAHFTETLSPLDDTTLQSEVDRVRKNLPEFDTAQDWNDISTETDALIRNQAGNKLRGIYANIIAGRNVAQHGIVSLNKDYAIKIADATGKTTEFSEYLTYNNMTVVDPKTGQTITYTFTTDKSGSLFLSAAVDAGKDPIQLELNDSLITAPIRALFMAYHTDYDTATCTNLLNQPYVRKLTSMIENKYGGQIGQLDNAKKAVIAEIRAEMTKRKAALGDKTPVTAKITTETVPMDAEDLKNMSKENRDLQKQLDYVQNFALFHKAGNKLMNLYKRITPDSMDGLNRIGNIEAYNDKARDFEAAIDLETGNVEDMMFYGPDPNGNVLDQFLGNESVYGLERGYETLKDNSLLVASYFFPMRTSPGFLNMKEKIKAAAGVKGMTSAMHQLVDANLTFLMLTKKGSPFIRYLEQKYAEDMYSRPADNIGTRLNYFKKQYPKLASTKFVSNFETEVDAVKKYYGVKFDGSFAFSRSEREGFTSTLRAMMYSPHYFLNVNPEDVVIKDGVIQDPKLKSEALQIKNLGQQLAMHSFLSSGFRQGAGSYHDIIPIEFWSQVQKVEGAESKSILDFLHEEGSKLGNANYFDNADIMTYMQLFGPMKAEGRPLLSRESTRTLNSKTTELSSTKDKQFLVFRNSKTNEIGTFMKIGKKGDRFVYGRLDSAFVGKTIYSLPNVSADEQMAKAAVFIDSMNRFINDTKIPKPKDSGNLMLCNG